MKKTQSGRILICVDDTDDLTKSTSTGRVAEAIMRSLECLGCRPAQGITRHQLLIHEDIRYTSHNSSMCFEAELAGAEKDVILQTAEHELRKYMAPTSDPGLCFCVISELRDPEKLIAFGKRAQTEIIRKQKAYDTASEIGGTILREYGGSGEGVIGALAGAGLRLSGCDGLLRGNPIGDKTNLKMTAAEWKSMLQIENIYDISGHGVSGDSVITSEGKIKLAMLDYKPSLIVRKNGDSFTACRKKDLMRDGRKSSVWNKDCIHFEEDNDIEECLTEGEKACYNCLYRRWTIDGFECVRKEESEE